MNYGKFEVLILPMLFGAAFRFTPSRFITSGVAIILLTLCIKILTWYPTAEHGRLPLRRKKMQAARAED